MNGAPEIVSPNEETLRLDRTPVRSRCQDRVERGPVPPVAPDDFTVIIGAVMAGETMRGLEREMEALGGPREAISVMMAVMQWVEDVFIRCREIQRDAGRMRGAVMAVGAGRRPVPIFSIIANCLSESGAFVL